MKDGFCRLSSRRGETSKGGYSWRVWAAWLSFIALLAVACVLLAADTPDVSRGTFVAIFWVFGILGTAGFFEFVNSRHRRSTDPSSDGIGVALAAGTLFLTVALVLFGGPPGLILAYLAARRLRRASHPFRGGLATTAVAAFAGVVDTVYLVAVLAGYEG